LVDQRPDLSRSLAVGTFGVSYAPEFSAPIEKLCRRDEPELFLSGQTLEGCVFACCHLPGLDLVGDEFAQFWVGLHASMFGNRALRAANPEADAGPLAPASEARPFHPVREVAQMDQWLGLDDDARPSSSRTITSGVYSRASPSSAYGIVTGCSW
jgi:hypothetical protein